MRVARLGREILLGLENPGADWVKLEVLGDTKTLLPDPVATLEATEQLVAEGFQVLCYTSDDPIIARRLKEAGATSVMPAGSPIGSGQGVLNPNNIRICLEYLKDGDPDYPVIVDAGVGTASDVTIAMELGVDGVLLNTGIAHARDPLRDGRRDEAAPSRPAGWRISPAAFPSGSTPRPAAPRRARSRRGAERACRRPTSPRRRRDAESQVELSQRTRVRLRDSAVKLLSYPRNALFTSGDEITTIAQMPKGSPSKQHGERQGIIATMALVMASE